MKVEFDKIEYSELKNYRDGEGTTLAKIIMDRNKKFMLNKLAKGSSIGYHTHDLEDEIIYVIKGVASINEDNDNFYQLKAGEVAIFHKLHAHGIKNECDEDLEFLTFIFK